MSVSTAPRRPLHNRPPTPGPTKLTPARCRLQWDEDEEEDPTPTTTTTTSSTTTSSTPTEEGLTESCQSFPSSSQSSITLHHHQNQNQHQHQSDDTHPPRNSQPRLPDRARSARAESCLLKERSRRLFNTVLQLELEQSHQQQLYASSSIASSSSFSSSPHPSQGSPSQVPEISLTSRPMTSEWRGSRGRRGEEETWGRPPHPHPHPLTNGPTRNGSILYNSHRSLLLSSMRTRRPGTETSTTPTTSSLSSSSGRFDHLRGSPWQHPDIQRTLELSNCEYRVGVLSPSCRPTHPATHSPLSPRFVTLIPVTSHISDVIQEEEEESNDCDVSVKVEPVLAEEEEEEILGSNTAGSRSQKKRSGPCRSKRSAGGGGARQTESRGKEKEAGVGGDRAARPTRWTPPEAVPRVNLMGVPPDEEEVLTTNSSAPPPYSSSSATSTDPPTLLKASQRPQALLSVPGSSSSKRQSSAKKRTTTPTPSPSPSRPSSCRSDASSAISSRTPRPRCWVDDVTISSNDDDGESVAERHRSLQQDLVEGKVGRGGEDRAASKTQGQGRGLTPGHGSPQRGSSPLPNQGRKQGGNVSKRATTSPNPPVSRPAPGATGKPGAKQPSGSKVEGVKDAAMMRGRGRRSGFGVGVRVAPDGGDKEEEEEEEAALPRFLCPSSESKSRQAALKEWLVKTSFSAACRTVPLM
ncbi:uncharacterized protein LOC143294795 isoform X2 [Babylonia areolata]|uniref:uncharacterized protein LOC143294795 isoform X2 n=1 Tax=Babylonia areolata TaxID=304850 RepID=UPI003FCF36EA